MNQFIGKQFDQYQIGPLLGEGGVGAVRVEVRGQDVDGHRQTLIAGIAELVGTSAAATATAFAEAGAVVSAPMRINPARPSGVPKRASASKRRPSGVSEYLHPSIYVYGK